MKLKIGRGTLVALALVCISLVGRAQSNTTGANSGLIVDGDPVITNWVVPEYPPEMKAQKLEGQVTVQMIVDETGKLNNLRVTKSSDPRFNDAVLKAFNNSVFAPAIEEGKPIATAVELTWNFTLPYHPPKLQPPLDEPLHTLPKKAATPDFNPNPEYPVSLIEGHLDGQVLFNLEIGKEGEVSNFKVLDASHPDFVRPAIDAVKRWKFHPATKGDLPVKDVKRAPLSFYYEGRTATDQRSPLEANGMVIQVPEGMTVKAVCDREPEILALVDPVFPLELLTAGQVGEAEVSFTINLQGVPEEVLVKNASHPSVGHSVAAAIEASLFNPAVLDGRSTAVKVVKKQQFALPTDVPQDEESSEVRLLRMIRSGEKISGPGGLDAKLTPLWRAFPRYPSALRGEGQKASALIEIVVDKMGRVRVPKIVSTTRDEFGWAAASAVAQWVFVPPTREGQPVDVKVRVPVEFSPPQ